MQRAQIEQWISEERSPIREVELIQQRLDIDAQLARSTRPLDSPSWRKRS
jgi:hypothetical protein